MSNIADMMSDKFRPVDGSTMVALELSAKEAEALSRMIAKLSDWASTINHWDYYQLDPKAEMLELSLLRCEDLGIVPRRKKVEAA